MTEKLLDRLLRRPGAASSDQQEASHWRRVPRLNVLPPRAAAFDRRMVVRGALIALVVVLGAYVLIQYRGKGQDQAAAELARTRLQDVQRDLAAEQAALEELQGKVDEARKRIEAAGAGYEQVTSGHTDWYPGLVALLETRIDGADFVTITAKPGGIIALDGVATDVGAMSRFQARLRERAQIIRLQNISFETNPPGLKFKATLKVVQ